MRQAGVRLGRGGRTLTHRGTLAPGPPSGFPWASRGGGEEGRETPPSPVVSGKLLHHAHPRPPAPRWHGPPALSPGPAPTHPLTSASSREGCLALWSWPQGLPDMATSLVTCFHVCSRTSSFRWAKSSPTSEKLLRTYGGVSGRRRRRGPPGALRAAQLPAAQVPGWSPASGSLPRGEPASPSPTAPSLAVKQVNKIL